MYLKRIEIHGFKSFAQKAILEFLSTKDGRNSITSVVGPNGSGKSNIVDAIRWVMGEQSLKTLRGKKSEDIIFSGSEGRGQMGMASVSMTLDNTDGKAPIDYEELVITRRIYRNGESEYLINENQVRLFDIQVLLAKAQFGQGSYSVIGQGMIDRLLLQTPQERKDFFDEASGIKEFQIKRHQSALKLSHTSENIKQAEMLLNEVEPRLRTLSRQVKKLERRQEVEIELREAQEKYYVTIYHQTQTQLDTLNQDLAKVNKEYNEANQRLSAVQTELANLARGGSRQDQFNELQNNFQNIVREKNKFERERAVLMGKLQSEYSQVGKQNVGWLEGKIEELKGEQERLQKEMNSAQANTDKFSVEADKRSGEMTKLTMERAEAKAKLSELEQRLAQIRNEQTFWQYTGLKAVQAILEERQRLGAIYGTVAQLGDVEEKYRMALDVAAGAYLSSIVVDSDRVAQTCIEYLRSHQLGVATFLPLNKIKPRFAPADAQDLATRSGVVGWAVDLVKFERKFADIFSYVLGNTLVVENLDAAREIGIGRVRMVTLDGDVLEVSGSMKGGFRKTERSRQIGFSKTSAPHMVENTLTSEEEKLNSWQTRLSQIELESVKTEEAWRRAQTDLQVALAKLEVVRTQKNEIDKGLAGFEQELSQCFMSPEEFSAGLKNVAEQKNDLDKQIEALEKQVKDAEEKLQAFNAQEEEKKQRVFSLQTQMQDEQNKLNKIVDSRNELQVSVAKLETKQEDLANEVYQEMHSSLRSVVERGVTRLQADELENALAEIQKFKYQLSLVGGIDEEVVKEYEETKTKHESLTTQLTDLKAALEDLEGLIVELDELMKKKRDKAFKEIKKEFSRYFELLFEGGKASLEELYGEVDESGDEVGGDSVAVGGDKVWNTDESPSTAKPKKQMLLGIDVLAIPPGKKIKNIQMLSGGERTLTSIALVCAILHTNPSPFVVLDEVEAALDEANTLRFTSILNELATQSQFIIITHNRATMHASDALYGVTMGGDGTSKLVSVALDSQS